MFMSWIIQALNSASSLFYSIYREVYGWVWPFYLAADLFYSLSSGFADLAWDFYYFSQWVDDVAARVNRILTAIDIISLLKTWLTYAENAWSWIVDAWRNVTDIVNTWWSSASQLVLFWIQEAKDLATSLFTQANTWLSSLQEAWDSFKTKIPSLDAVITWWSDFTGNILLVVNSWWAGALLQVQGLINSAFVIRQDLWAGWQGYRDKVTDFFTNPVEFVWKRFENWFFEGK